MEAIQYAEMSGKNLTVNVLVLTWEQASVSLMGKKQSFLVKLMGLSTA